MQAEWRQGLLLLDTVTFVRIILRVFVQFVIFISENGVGDKRQVWKSGSLVCHNETIKKSVLVFEYSYWSGFQRMKVTMNLRLHYPKSGGMGTCCTCVLSLKLPIYVTYVRHMFAIYGTCVLRTHHHTNMLRPHICSIYGVYCTYGEYYGKRMVNICHICSWYTYM